MFLFLLPFLVLWLVDVVDVIDVDDVVDVVVVVVVHWLFFGCSVQIVKACFVGGVG